jgi:hypothetical protein
MRTRTFLVAGAAILAASCAEMPKLEPMTTVSCTGTCDIEVIVGAGCVIQPIDPLHVAPGMHVIKWSLSKDTANRYSFAPNGIEFASLSAPFDQRVPGARVFTVRDNNPGNAQYGVEKAWKYTITILDGGVPCLDPLDPYVINDP